MSPVRLFGVVLLAAALLAGCGGDDPDAQAPSAASYVSQVEALLEPAAAMAQIVAAQLKRPPAPWPSPAGVDKLIDDASEALDDLRAIRLADARLREQRRRLVDASAIALGHMRDVGRGLGARDRAALRADAPRFFSALRDLSARP